MYSRWQLALKYLYYYFTSSGRKGHGIHSPFVFHFITKVLHDKHHYDEYDTVEELRRKLLQDKTVLTVQDFGAGSLMNKTPRRTIASIAKNAAKSKKTGQLLFRMVRKFQPGTILELGTSLGITTCYLSLANPGSRLRTIEGSKEIADVARKNFSRLGLTNISLTDGNFDDTLPAAIDAIGSLGSDYIDFAFIDGNHRREPTERYFHLILLKAKFDTILVFDDIHWSREMEEAWETIKKHPSVRCTLDLFFAGIVFFRKEFREKQQFRIRF